MALADNLSLYYKLDEASGSATDEVGANNLTENGTVGTRAGKIGTARDFSGSNSNYLSATDSAANSTGDIDWSVFLWMLADGGLSSFPVVAAKGFQEGGADREYQVYIDPSSGFQAQFRNETDGTRTLVWGGGAISTGTWYFVAFGNSTTLNEGWVSVNAGTPAVTGAGVLTAGTNNGAGTLRLGAAPNGGGGPLDGAIDEFAFFKRDIRADLASFYASGAGLAYPFSGGGGGGVIAQPYYALLLGGLGGPFG